MVFFPPLFFLSRFSTKKNPWYFTSSKFNSSHTTPTPLILDDQEHSQNFFTDISIMIGLDVVDYNPSDINVVPTFYMCSFSLSIPSSSVSCLWQESSDRSSECMTMWQGSVFFFKYRSLTQADSFPQTPPTVSHLRSSYETLPTEWIVNKRDSKTILDKYLTPHFGDPLSFQVFFRHSSETGNLIILGDSRRRRKGSERN